jgi:hypothetical protein
MMGWWTATSSSEDIEVTMGDEVLDATAEYLSEVARIYRQALKRPPTLAEVLDALTLSMTVDDGALVGDLAAQELLALKARLRPRRKRQRYKAGDYFSVPLGARRWGFGRIVYISKKMGPLTEFYDKTKGRPVSAAELSTSPVLFYCFASLTPFDEGRWRIMEGPELDLPEELKPRFVIRDSARAGLLYVLDQEVRPATVEEIASLPVYALYSDVAIEERLVAALQSSGHDLGQSKATA